MAARDPFDLTGRSAIITGGAGLLGMQHARAIASRGGHVVIADLSAEQATQAALTIERDSGVPALGLAADVTDRAAIERVAEQTIARFGAIDILINNAALPVKGGGALAGQYFARVEDYPLELWNQALAVNLTGTFVCCQVVGRQLAAQKRGVILNIASDVGVISPDHRIYEHARSPHTGEPFNTPPAYAATKAAVIHLTKYLATYWAMDGVRVNSLSPGGVFNQHDPQFVSDLTSRIPLGRMAGVDEYQGAVMFLVSDASSYIPGTNLIVDGGRTAW